MRKLVTIQKIRDIQPIENADAIELAMVGGWQVVVKKGQFKLGDLCVYFEIDSFLPDTPVFQFLKSSSYRKMGDLKGMRLRSIKLRQQISQGLILPLSDFNITEADGLKYFEDQTDLSEALGVVKWDPPLPAQLAGMAKGNFPSFIPKTDEERVQNLFHQKNAFNLSAKGPTLIDKIKDLTFQSTMKLDGSSCTVYLNNGEFGVCSRNLELLETKGNSFWQIVRREKMEDILRDYDKNIAIQFELMGPGIQGNREKFDRLEYFIFKIWDIDEQRYFSPLKMDEICSYYNLKRVPIIQDYIKFDANWTLQDFLNMAEIKSINHDIAEGIVLNCRENPEIHFKVISNKFLLNEKD